jgi:hypothetical protein
MMNPDQRSNNTMTTTARATSPASSGNTRYLIVAVLVAGAFFGAYRFAAARSADPFGSAAAGVVSPASGSLSDAAGAGAGCACCGSSQPTEGGVTGALAEGTATLEGDVQKIEVDLSQGIYKPNAITLKAGVPAEITFGQGAGCTAQVMSNELGFFEDLSAGPRTVELPALEKGEYPFYCGMQMVFGKIVVE